MVLTGKRKMITTLLGAIALACVGSATWELLVKPVGGILVDGILAIVTLGMDSLRDGLYEEAARRSNEYFSGLIASILTAAWITFALAVGYASLKLGFKSDTASDSPVHDDGLERRFRRKLLLSGWINLTLPIVLAFFMLVRIAYISETANFYTQKATAIAPYISADERLMLDSKFALIETRNDYIEVMADLQKKFEQAGLKPFRISPF